jgi:hypothetical protein
LAAQVRADMRRPRTAGLAREVVALQCRSSRLIHPRLVVDVESDVQSHAQANPEQPLPPKAEQKGGNHGGRTMEHARCGVLWRTGLVEEAHRRNGIPPALSHAEPRVVVHVDEHASRPQSQYVMA